MKKKICVIGLGYIGLPTAAVLAKAGWNVLGVDIRPEVVETINRGKIHIVEKDLENLVCEQVTQGNLRAVSEPQEADVFIVAVPTPFREDHEPDLTYVEAAVRKLAKVLKSGDLVILESTSPVGTTQKAARWMAEERPDLKFPIEKTREPDIAVAYCPERVLPGKILEELVGNDRLIGGLSPQCTCKAKAVYETFVRGRCLETDAQTAEMVKLTENAFRDVNIAFANELSLICDRLGLNVFEVIRLANHHPRVKILQPGPGVGGHCIAVDPWFIVAGTPRESRLIRTAREVNDAKPFFVVEKVLKEYQAAPKKKVACFGLTFKADVDDTRESPALEVVRRLIEKGIPEILVTDPYVRKLPKEFEDKPIRLVSLKEALTLGELLVLLVDHREFKAVEDRLLKGKRIIDTRGIWPGRGEDS